MTGNLSASILARLPTLAKQLGDDMRTRKRTIEPLGHRGVFDTQARGARQYLGGTRIDPVVERCLGAFARKCRVCRVYSISEVGKERPHEFDPVLGHVIPLVILL